MTIALIPAMIMGACAGLNALDRGGRRALRQTAMASGLALIASLALVIAAALGGIAGDPVALLTLVLTAFIGAIVAGFSHRYLRADADRQGYAIKVALLLGAVMLFAAAQDIVTLAIGWVASGWALTALIGHRRGWEAARTARRTALVSFAIADLALIAGLATYAWATGSLTLPAAQPKADVPSAIIAMLLLVAGMARCAAPPFHRWLGRSMTAPTPVSALMHAGFVNGGGVLLIRFAPLLEAAPVVRGAAVVFGLAAALVGTAIMLVRPDIKRSLAGSTVAQMGFMVISCGLGAYAAAFWHLIAHGLFKAWLFLRSGSAIGIGATGNGISLQPAAIAALGSVGIGTAALLATWGLSQASVPVALALVSALASMPGLVARPALLPVGLVVAGSYVLGLASVEQLLTHPLAPPLGGPALPPGAIPAMIVSVFVVAWWVQSLIAAGRLPLPAALHARLLTA